jgi:hypothetical protein
MKDENFIFDFWSEIKTKEEFIHPQDKVFFNQNTDHQFLLNHRPPGPFDGPLKTAKVVICYANPSFDETEKKHSKEIFDLLKGSSELPRYWDTWYEPRFRSIGIPLDQLRNQLAVFNICPYPSQSMGHKEEKIASGLKSVWIAQKYLREVLIPKASRKEVFLVIARKHQLWGITNGIESANLKLNRNRIGSLTEEIGLQIKHWLG